MSHSNFIPNFDEYTKNLNLPEAKIPRFDDNFLSNLIGGFDPTSSNLFGNHQARTGWEEEYKSIISKGDGNAAVAHIVKGLNEGTISKEEAIELAKKVQQEANANGGGKINGEMRDALKDALGTDVDHIAKGKTRALIGFEKFLKGVLSIFGL